MNDIQNIDKQHSIGQLTHEDVGQMDSYIRMWDALYNNESTF